MGKKKNNPILFISLLVFFIAAAFGGMYYLNKKQNDKLEEKSETSVGQKFDFDIKGQQVIGKADAPVTIVEFSDFVCPACTNWHSRVFPDLKSKYIDTGKVKLVSINLPLEMHGQPALISAKVSETLSRYYPEKFETYYNSLYNNHAELEGLLTNKASEKEIYDWLYKTIKRDLPDVDIAKIEKGLQEGIGTEEVEKDMKIVEAANVTATPTLFVNGERVEDIVTDANGQKSIGSAPFSTEKIYKLIEDGLKKSGDK